MRVLYHFFFFVELHFIFNNLFDCLINCGFLTCTDESDLIVKSFLVNELNWRELCSFLAFVIKSHNFFFELGGALGINFSTWFRHGAGDSCLKVFEVSLENGWSPFRACFGLHFSWNANLYKAISLWLLFKTVIFYSIFNRFYNWRSVELKVVNHRYVPPGTARWLHFHFLLRQSWSYLNRLIILSLLIHMSFYKF